MRRILAPLALGLFAAPALADDDYVSKSSAASVAETMDALVAAVEGAGATVFARVDHGGGASSVEMELADAELLIFGNPRLGTPVMQQDIRAGLYLPLRVLVYEDGDGATQVLYETPDEMLDDLDVPEDLEVIGTIEGALDRLTGAATGG